MELEAALSDQTMETPASAREADLDPVALAMEQASEAAAPPYQVHRDVPCRAQEALPADPPTVRGAPSKALAPMVLAAITVVTTVDSPVSAMAMMVLVWAAATD